LSLSGGQTGAYDIQASTNFADWETLTTVVNASGTLQFTDTAATNYILRFYRAVGR
jgi:hypothetical protein